jgi:hypothetical protein
MHHFVRIAAIGLALPINLAFGAEHSPHAFVDGLWSGGFELHADSPASNECWAGTTSADGTTLTLATRRSGDWYLRLLNAQWELPVSGEYDLDTLVDFYPRIWVEAKAQSQTLLEIPIRGQNPLLGLIENGHLITLTSDTFNGSYSLEGSAKIIERIRMCASDTFS